MHPIRCEHVEPYLLVFVCTGNICRSPMAEGIMKDRLCDAAARIGESLPVRVVSAGTHAPQGAPASEHAVIAAAEHGIDISAHRSQPLTGELIEQSDLILTMEQHHSSQITYHWPLKTGISELKRFALQSGIQLPYPDVADPIGSGLVVYRETYNEIAREIDRITPVIIDRARARQAGG